MGSVAVQQTVLLLRPRRLPGGGVHLTWSLYWPRTGHRTRDRHLFGVELDVLGVRVLEALRQTWGRP